MPVEWKDLRAIDPHDFDITTVPAAIEKRRRDPWADLLEARQTLPRELIR
jgi:DNA primase